MSAYYYRHLDYQHGPIGADDLRYLLQNRLLPPATPIWPVDGTSETAVALTSLLDPAPNETLGATPGARPNQPAEPVPASRPEVCARCAAALVPNSRFCTQCGAPLSASQRQRHSGPRRPPTLPLTGTYPLPIGSRG